MIDGDPIWNVIYDDGGILFNSQGYIGTATSLENAKKLIENHKLKLQSDNNIVYETD